MKSGISIVKLAANRHLRGRLSDACEEAGVTLHIAPIELCTDNAVMGAIAWEQLKAGKVDDLQLDAVPGLVRR